MEARENILLIRFKSIGDIVLTLPAVNAVRENFPSAKITFLTLKNNAPLLRGFANIDEILMLDRAALQYPWRATPEIFRLLRRLRIGKFSLVVDFQGYGETGWLSRWTGAPRRWGSVYRAGRRWLYTRGVDRDDKMQIADFNLRLLQECGLETGKIRNEFVLPDDPMALAKEFFLANRLDSAKPTLFLQPFTSTPGKNWPLENFMAVAEYWRARGKQVLFGGGPSERGALAPAFAAGFPVAAGVPLLTAAGLMRLSTVTVGGVTGLLHLAVAMQRRVLMLVASPDREPGLPYQHKDWVVAPSMGSPLHDLKTEAVIAACDQAFNEPAGNVSCRI